MLYKCAWMFIEQNLLVSCSNGKRFMCIRLQFTHWLESYCLYIYWFTRIMPSIWWNFLFFKLKDSKLSQNSFHIHSEPMHWVIYQMSRIVFKSLSLGLILIFFITGLDHIVIYVNIKKYWFDSWAQTWRNLRNEKIRSLV